VRPRLPHGYCPRCATPLELQRQEDRDRPTCPSCGFVHYLDPKVAVAVVVELDVDQILLVRRNIDPGRGLWSFPAGYVNRGEVLEEAAIREVEEEIGLKVDLIGLVGVYSSHGDSVVLVVYSGRASSAHPPRIDPREVQEARAWSVNALPAMAFQHDPRVMQDWRRLRARA
jgi:8-oxo-dGTP diphosphatase